jgi:hypothetical protein
MAPIVDEHIFTAFRTRGELRLSLQRAFIRMLDFYGFIGIPSGENMEIAMVSNFEQVARHWLTRFDHNHLRITRIIRSLRVLGLEQNAGAFYRCLFEVNNQFKSHLGPRSLEYWKRAALRPLYIAPDEDDDNASSGRRFLIDYEASRAAELESKTALAGGEASELPRAKETTEQKVDKNAKSGESIETAEESSNATSCPVPE